MVTRQERRVDRPGDEWKATAEGYRSHAENPLFAPGNTSTGVRFPDWEALTRSGLKNPEMMDLRCALAELRAEDFKKDDDGNDPIPEEVDLVFYFQVSRLNPHRKKVDLFHLISLSQISRRSASDADSPSRRGLHLTATSKIQQVSFPEFVEFKFL